METNKETTEIIDLLAGRKLRMAIDQLESLAYKHPELSIMPSLEQIRSDYDLMAGYWQRGFKDASLDSVYDDLVCRMYRLTTDSALAYDIAHNSFLTAVNRRVRSSGRDDSFMSSALARLESFVSDLAMLDLEPETTRQGKKEAIYAKRQAYVNDLFDYIWTSGQWTDGTMETLSQLLLSPTIDTIDQQVIVSAVTLGALNRFDPNKLRLLADVYRKSSDESVRQRALVGTVFALGTGMTKIFPAERTLVEELLADEDTRNALTELQIQMLYCVSAEDDTKKVQKELMPDIIKHNNLHITPRGIEEREDDLMEDILHPEASEHHMEKMEESFRKMISMQMEGADIYFGGFSQMKRFPFFDTVSNWFVPYYKEHPAISALYLKADDTKIVNNMVERAAFCESDKYSFVIALHKVVERLPKNIRELMSHDASKALMGEVTGESTDSPAYIRRMYLQDFYRFFRLFHSRTCFNSPFEVYNGVPGYVFFANPIFKGTALENRFNEIVACMMKRKLYADAIDVLRNYSDGSKDYQYYMFCGSLAMRHPDIANAHGLTELTASDYFRHAMQLKQEKGEYDVKAAFSYARSMFYEGSVDVAAGVYADLMREKPGDKRFVLGYCVCQTNLGHYDDTLPQLYKLNYESPDDDTVKRVLARALVGCEKYEQALKLYDSMGTQDGEDIVNRGYCEWFMGNVQQAIDHFAEYVTLCNPNADTETKRRQCYAEVIDSEHDFILSHGISETEIQLMVDAMRDAIVR